MRLAICVLALGTLLLGCGGGEEYRYADETETEQTAYANDVVSRLRDMRTAESPAAIDTVGYLEGVEGYGDSPPVGEHGATYDEIHAGVREVQTMVESGASRDQINQKLDELIEKAESLPHTVQTE